MHEAAIAFGLTGVERLLQCVQHEVRRHASTHSPANDAPGEHVDHEGHIQPALPGRNTGEIRNPELVRPIRPELAVHPIQRARLFGVGYRRAHAFTPHRAAQSQAVHQALDGAARDPGAFALHLPPDLVRAVDLKIGLPDAFDPGYQYIVALRTRTTQRGIALACGMKPVARRGDLQDGI